MSERTSGQAITQVAVERLMSCRHAGGGGRHAQTACRDALGHPFTLAERGCGDDLPHQNHPSAGEIELHPLRIMQIVRLTRAARARLSIWAQSMTTPTTWMNRPAQTPTRRPTPQPPSTQWLNRLETPTSRRRNSSRALLMSTGGSIGECDDTGFPPPIGNSP